MAIYQEIHYEEFIKVKNQGKAYETCSVSLVSRVTFIETTMTDC